MKRIFRNITLTLLGLLPLLSSGQGVHADMFLPLPSSAGAERPVWGLLASAKGDVDAQPDKALSKLENALSMSIDQKSEQGKAYSYSYTASVNYYHERYDLALRNYKRALNSFKDLNHRKGINHCYKYLGLTYQKGGDPKQAAAQLELYLDQLVEPKDVLEITIVREKLGEVYYSLSDFPASERNYVEAVRVQVGGNDTAALIQSYNELGTYYLNRDNSSQAVLEYQNGVDLGVAAEDTVSLVQSYVNLGNAYNSSYDTSNAYSWTSVATTLANDYALNTTDNGVLNTIAGSNFNLGVNYAYNGDAEDAIPLLEESVLQFNAAEGALLDKANAYKALSETYAAKEDFENALKNYQLYMGLVDSLEDERMERQERALMLNALLDDREETISGLEQTKELDRANIRALKKDKQANQILIWSLVGGLLLVAGAALLIYRSSQQKRRANQLLALRSLRTQMNPHFIFNSLNSVNSFIAANDERSANKYLSEFSKLMRNVLENSKHDFVSLGNEIKLLELYLGLEHFRFKDKFEYSFNFDKSIDTEELQVPPMLIQPYIENAIWHGLRYKNEKGFLSVNITRQSGHLTVTVEDNGIGRKRSAALKTRNQREGESTGLKNIRERLGIINDLHNTDLTVEIEDLQPEDEDAGTRVSLQIPCNLEWES
jgi:two-component system LytT family sensor kinase